MDDVQIAQLFVLEQERAQGLLLIPIWKSEAYLFLFLFLLKPMKITFKNQTEMVSYATGNS